MNACLERYRIARAAETPRRCPRVHARTNSQKHGSRPAPERPVTSVHSQLPAFLDAEAAYQLDRQPMPAQPAEGSTGTATILFTDLVASTTWRVQLREERAQGWRQAHPPLPADALPTHPRPPHPDPGG